MQTAYSSTQPLPRLRRTPLDLVGLLLILMLLALLTTAATWQFWHANRIYTGVAIGGVPVGGLTRAEASKLLREQLYAYPLPPVSVTYQGQHWPLPTGQVSAEFDLQDAVNQAYLAGRTGSPLENLQAQLQYALLGRAILPELKIDPVPLQAALDTLAQRLDQPGLPARRIGTVETPAQPGIVVDEATTLAQILAVLQQAGDAEAVMVPLGVTTTAPPAPEVEAPAVSGANLPIQTPLILRAEQSGVELALDPALLQRFVVATEPLQVNATALHDYLATLAPQVEVPARDARLRFNPDTGGVAVIQSSQPGRSLDVDATVESIQAALASGSDTARLALVETAPAVDSNRIAEMGIRELVAQGSTYFAGSSGSRTRNIEVAAEKFAGVVVPPDGVFSFNDVVRDVSAANGFEDSLVIWGDRTAVGVGGGVCQVSTTIFRTAYEGGFPIVQRYNHGYVVDWYGEPGMDATIFTPSVDFKFRNDTGAYLLLEPVVDSANGVITFNFYGTRPDRDVTISKPEISDLEAPKPPQYVVDETLGEGEQKQVDWEKEGMTAKVTRTIVENGTTRTDTLVSKYQPWQAVYLVGPGVEIPATPTPAPATETP